MHTLHTSWRCPACGVVRDTTPVAQAFCVEDDCCFGAMDRHKTLPDLTTALAYPHLTPEQSRYDREMRANRGIMAIL